MTITELTPEQKVLLEEYKIKYRALGLNTDTTDKAKATTLIEEYYLLNGLKKPIVMFADSPYRALLNINILKQAGDVDLEFIRKLEVTSTTKLKIPTKREYYKSMFEGIFDNRWLAIYTYINEVLGVELDKATNDKFQCYKKLSNEVFFWYPFPEICFVSCKPTKILLDQADRLHNDLGAALEFADGYGVYAYHGIRLTGKEWIITNREQITAAKINAETNAEIRRVMLEIYGFDNYIKESSPEILDETVDQFGRPMQLLRIKNGDDEPIMRLKVVNSTPEPYSWSSSMSGLFYQEQNKPFKYYLLPVDFELRPLLKDPDSQSASMTRSELIKAGYLGKPQKLTCRNAQASTFGKYGEEWGLPGQIRQGDVFIEFKDGTNQKKFRES